MKYLSALFLTLIIIIPIYGNNSKTNFLHHRYKENIKIPIKSLKKPDDLFYTSLSYFAFDSVKGWERAFYLFKKQKKYSQAQFSNYLHKFFPKLFDNRIFFTKILLISIYNQQYDFFYRNIFDSYKNYLYEGNLDQWWDFCEMFRHFLKNNHLHPNFIHLKKLNNDTILIREKPLIFHYMGNFLTQIVYDNDEIRYYLEKKRGYLIGNVLKKYGEFKPLPINVHKKDLNIALKYKIYFGKIKAGYMYYYFKDAPNFYELYIMIKTTTLVNTLFKIRDYIYIKFNKNYFLPTYLFENLNEGQYHSKRWTTFEPSKFKAKYKDKEGIGIGNLTYDSYSLPYLIKEYFPKKVKRIFIISRKRVYPFSLYYKPTNIKIKGKFIRGFLVSPKPNFKPNKKQKDFKGTFFIDNNGKLIFSKTYTSYGTLTSYFDRIITFKQLKKEGFNYENFSN